MRFHRLAAPALLVFAAACGASNAPAVPDDATMDITTPDDADSNALTGCADGDAAFKGDAKKELDELLEASRPYREIYRGLAKAAKATKKGGGFERTFTGAKGTATFTTTEADDGTITMTLTGKATGQDDAERKVFEGHVAADGLSGDWAIFAKDGAAVRTIVWTKSADGSEITSTWTNTKNKKVAVYHRTATTVTFTLTFPNGTKLAVQFDRATKAGSATISGSQTHDGQKCWDASLCDAACPS